MPGDFYGSMDSKMRKAVRRALNRMGRDGVAYCRFLISTPVQYVSGPRGGRIAIRSEPGEPPRREFRVLWKSIKYKVQPRATNQEDLTIYTDNRYAPFLEYGTDFMEPRPFWAPTKEAMGNLKTLFKKRLKEELSGQ